MSRKRTGSVSLPDGVTPKDVRKPKVLAALSPVSRAGRLPKTTYELRIAQVVDLMSTLRFHAGTTTAALADEWGVSVSSAQKVTSEASRIVRAAVCDPDQVAQDVGSALRDVMATGTNRDKVLAARVWAEVAGAMAPKQIEYRTEASMTADELRARLQELQARADEYAPRQLPEMPCSVVGDVRASQQPPASGRGVNGKRERRHPPPSVGAATPTGGLDDQSRENGPGVP